MDLQTQRLMMAAAGAAGGKTYVDDLFSTYLYKGNATARSINNGIDLAGEGGLVWTKSRSHARNHSLHDSERGVTCLIKSNSNTSQYCDATQMSSFNSNGFSLGTDGSSNTNGDEYTSWTFRKAPGFFDVLTYTGGSGTQTISHNLGCVPGMIIVKRTDSSDNWAVFHRNMDSTNPNNYGMKLNTTDARFANTGWNVTATTFDAAFSLTNDNGAPFVAYLFAGGESTAATARSVDFDGTNDYLSIADSSDFTIGTNYTAECWFYADAITGNGWDGIFGQWSGNNNAATNSWVLESVGSSFVPRFYYINSGGTLAFKSLVDEANGEVLALKQWHHFAFVKSGSTTKLYLNGILKQSFDTTYQDGSGSFNIGGNVASGGWFNGKVSNVRIVNGTAVYTSSFIPPTAPLTNITNTKLLCCNDSSQTGSTVTPGTITNNGSTASSDSPFDDSAGFVFGDSEDQNVIKCGSYVGNGSSTGPEINLGWEPQWILVKNTNLSTEQWFIFDTMRGIISNSTDYVLEPSRNVQEAGWDLIDLTPTGFKIKINDDKVNNNGGTYIFTAIRRPDGYVGKPPELGTDVFAMDTGSSSSTIPTYDSGFPVDFAFARRPAATDPWYTSARLIHGKYLLSNNSDPIGTSDNFIFDSNSGWAKDHSSDYQSWMWKRHAGFDVVYGLEESNIHNLGKPIEMIWVKRSDNTSDWFCWHKGLNGGGSNAVNHHVRLNTTAAESSISSLCPIGDTLPTATQFKTGSDSDIRNANSIAFLFASVDGISKVGSYTGNGTSSSSTQTISTGFAPRFLLIKNITDSNSWFVADTTRGWASGDDQLLMIDSNSAQLAIDWGVPTSNGFTITGDNAGFNANNKNYIYYAHA